MRASAACLISITRRRSDNRTYIPRAKHIALRYYFFVQELVEGKVSIHYVKSEGELADFLVPKHHRKYRHRDLIEFINDFEA